MRILERKLFFLKLLAISIIAFALLISAGCTAESESSISQEQKETPISETPQLEEVSEEVDEPESEPVTVSEDEWKALYKEVLMDKETYSGFNENRDNPIQIDLIDLDQNGVPELYVYSGVMPNYILDGIYDAATGELVINREVDMYGNEVYKNKTTGDYVLSGVSGGSSGYSTFWLVPLQDNLGFKYISGDGFIRSPSDEDNNIESADIYGDFDDSDYEEVFDMVKTLSLYDYPTEAQINEFLGIPGSEWITLYRDFLNNELDYEEISFVVLVNFEDPNGIPNLYAGTFALQNTIYKYFAYVENGELEVEEEESFELMQDIDDLPRLEVEYLDRGNPTESEVEEFLGTWK